MPGSQRREADIDLERADSEQQPERDALVERDSNDPLVIVERDDARDDERSAVSANDALSKNEERNPTRDVEPEKTPEIDRSAKPSHEEFMRMIEEQERALLKEEAKQDRERGTDRSQDIDDGFDL